jgi:SAM-dependent methyltransferase
MTAGDTTTADAPATHGTLTDPATIGEDFAHNVDSVVRYALDHCRDCIDYHMLFPIRRAIGRVGTVTPERDELIALLSQLIAARGAAHDGPIDIVVAGTADTQIPATCIHTALVHCGAAFARVRLTVLDQCDTPLKLCRDFAARHGLNFRTQVADLVTTDAAFPADILINHSLFNYVDAGHHEATLRKFAGWLKPGGRIVFYIGLRPPALQTGIRNRNQQAHDLIRAALDSGALKIAEPRASFEARLDRQKFRVAEFSTVEDVYALFARSGLTVHAGELVEGPLSMPSSGALGRGRVLAALGRD